MSGNMLDDSLAFEDGIRVEFLKEKDFAEAGDLFKDIWLRFNTLYTTAKITPEVFQPYLDILLDRARLQPFTVTIAIDQNKGNRIVAISLFQDLFDDPIDPKRFRELPKPLQPIMQFNDEAIQHFTENPLFSQLFGKRPRRVIYGLHAGTAEGYTGRECNGMTISQRMSFFHAFHLQSLGFQALIGVSTHPETVDRALVMTRDRFDTIVLTSKPISPWVFDDGKKSYRPFESLKNPESAVVMLVLFPNFSIAKL
eukprot:TRINITY_DN1517_c0_g1_i1.p1 TRINITY_DN1517_c0_g1~~TRINITY_DN1517_c0_g1_i1.p1  ORF type:complete len:276 (-),score=85.44 TRINITY_DN1517_c0_g1_i1:54-815(-)